MHHDQQLLGTRAKAVRVVPSLEIRGGVQRLAGRGREYEARIRPPVMDPTAIGALEVPLWRARPENPTVEHRRIDLLGSLPHSTCTRERTLQQRAFHPLSLPRKLPCAQRGTDSRTGRE